jgi:outer membrane lipoprotein-sorting protein
MNLRVLTAICVVAATAATTSAGIVEDLRSKYAGKGTIVVEFDLTILWKVREKQESRSGRMQLAPGDKFRVELGATTWACNGQTVWQYSTKTKQVVIKRLLDFDLSSHPSQILATYVNDYDYGVLEENDRQAVLQWESLEGDAKSFYRSITIYYDKHKGAMSSLILVDRHGNESTYLFKRTVFGEKIARETFQFAIPKGVDVLDERN